MSIRLQTSAEPHAVHATMWLHNTLRLVTLFLVFSITISMPIDDDFDIDIERTVENVQNILDAHPELPRLTNEDIMMLLKNITAEDRRKIGIPREKKEDEKIMIVLPYTSTSTKAEDITDLFTKRPITKYVSSHSYTNTESTTPSVKKQHNKKANKKENEATTEKITFDNEKHPLEGLQIPESEVSAFETFKPLPLAYKQDIDIPIDVKNVLKTYDLLQNSNKALVSDTETAQSNQTAAFDYVDPNNFPPEMADVLKELGLVNTNDSSSSRAYLPIASPPETTTNSGSTVNELAAGIDPVLSGDEGVIDDDQTNDIKKRQQSNTTTTTAAETTVSTTEGTTKASGGPSIADLEDSFGGSKADNDPSQAELPPPRRNGFYYMLDWNSFLEVGDGDSRVNIRFDPKLGDPQRFIPV